MLSRSGTWSQFVVRFATLEGQLASMFHGNGWVVANIPITCQTTYDLMWVVLRWCISSSRRDVVRWRTILWKLLPRGMARVGSWRFWCIFFSFGLQGTLASSSHISFSNNPCFDGNHEAWFLKFASHATSPPTAQESETLLGCFPHFLETGQC